MKKLLITLLILFFFSCGGLAKKICPEYCNKIDSPENFPTLLDNMQCRVVFLLECEEKDYAGIKDFSSVIPYSYINDIPYMFYFDVKKNK